MPARFNDGAAAPPGLAAPERPQKDEGPELASGEAFEEQVKAEGVDSRIASRAGEALRLIKGGQNSFRSKTALGRAPYGTSQRPQPQSLGHAPCHCRWQAPCATCRAFQRVLVDLKWRQGAALGGGQRRRQEGLAL